MRKLKIILNIETEEEIDLDKTTLGDLLDYLNETPSCITNVQIIQGVGNETNNCKKSRRTKSKRTKKFFSKTKAKKSFRG